MAKGQQKTKSNVCIVESLDFMDEDARREGEIISRTLKMSGKRPYYVYIRSRDELEAFAKEFGKSEYRYLHISCHGGKGAFYTTLNKIDALDLARILAPHVNHRRVFLSACLAAKSKFAHALMNESECYSVVAPVGAVYFDDAAIFWTSFYHLMFKENPVSMKNAVMKDTLKMCARLIGEEFRFFCWESGKLVEHTIR